MTTELKQQTVVVSTIDEIKKIIEKSSKLLKYNGKLIIEIGEKQKNYIIKILQKNGFYIKKICKDFSGKDRCLISTKLTNE